jgi:hypothetical protein
MIFFLFTILAGAQVPKTFEDLELAKIVAVHDLKNLKMEMTLPIPLNGELRDGHVDMLFSGDRRKCTISADGAVQMETIDNPPYHSVVVPPQKKYEEVKSDPPKDLAFDPKTHLLKTPQDEFRFQFESSGTVQFSPGPEFVLSQVEAVQEGTTKLRKIVAKATSKSTGHVLTVTQWFLSDKWILKKFTIDSQTDDGAISLRGEVTLLDFKATFKDADFVLDRSSIQGYEKVDGVLSFGGDSRRKKSSESAETGVPSNMYLIQK